MKAGMTREEAEKAAVCDMGDPVTTGISLDQIHRPKMARQIIVLMAVIMFAGVLIHWMMGAPVACMQTISGFCLMFFICHLDYTRIAAIAKVICCRNYPGWYLCFILWSQVRWKHLGSQSVMA